VKAFIILRRPNDWITLVTPYEPDYIDALKFKIPSSHRDYDPESRSWDIYGVTYVRSAIALVHTYFNKVEELMPHKPMQQQPPPNPPPWERPHSGSNSADQDYTILGLLPGATKRLIEAAYKARVHEFHPDANGIHKDGKAFIELTSAYERLLRKVRE